jgi:hypothetical protein
MKITVHIDDATPEELKGLLQSFGCDNKLKRCDGISNVISNVNAPKWTPEERETISKCPDGYAAIEAHRKKYPLSERTDAAIRRQWIDVRSDKNIIVPCNPQPEPKAPSDIIPEPKKKSSTNKFGIPYELLKSDKKLYERLYKRCLAKGIMYGPALLLEKEKSLSHVIAGPENHNHLSQPISNPDVALRSGNTVKHIGSKASPFFGKIGSIQKISADGQLFIKFGESFTWISPYQVMVVTEP